MTKDPFDFHFLYALAVIKMNCFIQPISVSASTVCRIMMISSKYSSFNCNFASFPNSNRENDETLLFPSFIETRIKTFLLKRNVEIKYTKSIINTSENLSRQKVSLFVCEHCC